MYQKGGGRGSLEGNQIRSTLPYIRTDIPVVIIFRALGYVADRDIIEHVVYDLTDDQYCQALLTDYGVAYARTVAGVHYPTDNIAGLNLGQKIVADYLEEHLVTRYGANREATRNKIASKLFDWNNFDPVTCTTT